MQLTVTPLSAEQIQVSAKKAGVTQVNLWDEDNNVYTVDVLIYGDVRELELALQRILAGPEFLFRIEKDPEGAAPGTIYPVSQLDLASRLSFFLWSSIPDRELLVHHTAPVPGDRAPADAAPRGPEGAPRCVAQLAFPEILVIWALRRYTNCRLSAEARLRLQLVFDQLAGLKLLEMTANGIHRHSMPLSQFPGGERLVHFLG